MSSFILLSAKGEFKSVALASLGTAGIEVALGKAIKRAKAPTLIGSYVWQKYKLFLYGYKEGRAGTENKHEMPPPHDEILLFGDACLVASLDKSAEKPASFTVDQYKKFYNQKFGGFEDLAEEDEEDEEEEEEDDEEAEEEFEEEEDNSNPRNIVDSALSLVRTQALLEIQVTYLEELNLRLSQLPA